MNKTILVSLDALGAKILSDKRVKAPWIRKMIQDGAYVNELHTIFPSVTWAIHSTVVTGKYPSGHGMLANRVYNRTTGETIQLFNPLKCQNSELFQAPSISGLIKEKGLSCDAICWPLTQGDPGIRHNIPEFYSQEHFESFSSREIWEKLRADGLPIERYGEWSAKHHLGPLQDSLTAEICKYLIRNDMPDLLLTHFLLIDSFLHDYGIGAPETLWAIEYVDRLIGELLQTLESENLINQVNVILFSDHGQAPVQHEIQIGKLLDEVGLYHWQPVSNGGAVFLYRHNTSGNQTDGIYLNQKAGEIPQAEQQVITKCFQDAEWLDRIIWPEQYPSINFPDINSENIFLPDAILEMKPGYIGGENRAAEHYKNTSTFKGMHGYKGNLPDMTGFLTAWGPDITKKMVIEKADMTDIAPTLAKIFDLPEQDWDGKYIDGLLIPEIAAQKIEV